MQGALNLVTMDETDVRKAYRRWAPVYDKTFGKFVEAGVRQATARANDFHGTLLEAGVGTGLALPFYGDQLRVTGIDLSPDMLERAEERVEKSGKSNVESLIEMDAGSLAFADNQFDVAVAMFVMTVVPEPRTVMAELARVVKPGGVVLILNHFSVQGGIRGAIEKRLAKHASKLGWRPEFPIETISNTVGLQLVKTQSVKPFGFFTMLEFRKVN